MLISGNGDPGRKSARSKDVVRVRLALFRGRQDFFKTS